MKKILSLLLISIAFSNTILTAQSNTIGANEEFYQLLMQMGSELQPPKNVGSFEMLKNLDSKIDDNLAYKYLWQKNQFVKPEETHCHPIGFILNKENNIAILFFYKGEADNLSFFVEVQTYNYKSGKLVDQLPIVGSFNDRNIACDMQVVSPNLIQLKTVSLINTENIEVKINNRGKIDRN